MNKHRYQLDPVPVVRCPVCREPIDDCNCRPLVLMGIGLGIAILGIILIAASYYR